MTHKEGSCIAKLIRAAVMFFTVQGTAAIAGAVVASAPVPSHMLSRAHRRKLF